MPELDPPYYLTDKGKDYRQRLEEKGTKGMTNSQWWDYVVLRDLENWDVIKDISGYSDYPGRFVRPVILRLFEAGYIDHA